MMMDAHRLVSQFAAADSAMAMHRVYADALRAERVTLMADWSELVASRDFDAIGVRSNRLAEIVREIAKLGG